MKYAINICDHTTVWLGIDDVIKLYAQCKWIELIDYDGQTLEQLLEDYRLDQIIIGRLPWDELDIMIDYYDEVNVIISIFGFHPHDDLPNWLEPEDQHQYWIECTYY